LTVNKKLKDIKKLKKFRYEQAIFLLMATSGACCKQSELNSKF